MTGLDRIRDELLRAAGSAPAAPSRRRAPVMAAGLALLVGAVVAAVALRSGGGEGVAGSDDDVRLVAVGSARSDADGTRLVLGFVGSDPDLAEDDPCSAGYRGVARVEGSTVFVGVEELLPDWDGGTFDCTAVGHPRNVTVDLPEPLGDRQVRDLVHDETIDVFDGERVCTPATVPPGYAFLAEYEAPGPLRAWSVVFTAASTVEDELRHELSVQAGDRTLADQYAAWPAQPTLDIDGTPVEIRRHPDDPARHVALVDAGSGVVRSAEYRGPADAALAPEQLAEVLVGGCSV